MYFDNDLSGAKYSHVIRSGLRGSGESSASCKVMRFLSSATLLRDVVKP